MEQQFFNEQHPATFGSPATPRHEERGVEMLPKGWSSERVPLSKYSNRNRHVGSSTVALFPFSSGRTLPSKWDDAERWISSPVFGQEGSYSSKSLQLVQSERRAKSKSGPLGPQMLGNYGNYSPVMPVIYGGGVSSSVTADSPLLGQSNYSYGGGRRRSCPGNEEELASTREWLKLLNEPPGAESQEEKSDGGNEVENQVRRVVSRRDMGTQMLPSEGSSTTSYSSPPHAASSEMDEMVKDVKVDKEDTLPIRRSTNRSTKSRANRSRSSRDSNSDNITESRTSTPKLQSEEARINEWENLQRAKAEAAIEKLEMKLEKMRSSSMEKIMKKLERAESKAEKMRTSLSESNGRGNQVSRKARGRVAGGLYRRIQMGSITNCLACG